jgi:hypothetical protein
MKTITIFRTKSFFETSQPGAAAYLSKSKQSVGGYWASPQSKAVGKGLTPSQERLLLPTILDVDADDRDFRKEVKAFYEGLETKVPYVGGVTLRISLEDDTKELSKENLPLEVMDYLRYKHAIGHPEVAESLDLAEGDLMKKFYVHDPNTVKDRKEDLRKAKDEAMQAYLNISKSPEKIDNVLALLGEDPRKYSAAEKLDWLQAKAASAVLAELTTFIDTVADKQLEIKGFIRKLVVANILKTVGTRYMFTDTSAIIGNDLEETVLELQDEVKNSETIVVLKAKLQDAMKKKIATKK